MLYKLLPELIAQEGSDFQHIENRWRPTTLFLLQQVRLLLRDMQSIYKHLDEAKEELSSLDRADKYNQYFNRMRLYLRQANYKWKSDQLNFLQAVSGFYSDYGAILRLLKFDQARGKFNIKKDNPEMISDTGEKIL